MAEEGVEGVGKGRERVSGCAACMSHSNRVLSSPLQDITDIITGVYCPHHQCILKKRHLARGLMNQKAVFSI